MQHRLATPSDLEGVLNLQTQNLYRNLTEKERENGFVTTPFTIPQLEQIIAQDGLFITVDKEKIIAYVFAGTWAYFSQWEIFNFMVARFPMLSFQGEKITTANSFEYGPVCVDANYRGQGIFQNIFETMRSHWVEKFPISITFINAVNDRSIHAHTRKLAWEIIDKFEFNGNQYYGLAYDMTEPVVI